ncbi:SDR family oxidoreductase [Acidisoma cellulosilytica]|uniref:SDR family oxidoreductase n=1 Tax=Acidisoma cellulosilyticum TaxID=2802395 RepID=A0A963Z3U0_9PROT|nr:D-erythronate dehydrogenase [Acidisoma cellulosilyticum]MCB8882253.1 SDR family oxidoreductase [Acidisoma cellulosilyticum]
MHVLIIGAAGMLGRKLSEGLVSDGKIGDRAIKRLTLADAIAPKVPHGFTGDAACVTVDLTAPDAAASLLHAKPDVIFHLAAIVSGEAEVDFEKGYAVNLDGTRALFEEIRLAQKDGPWKPRLVFASSIAVFGGDMPDVIGDDYFHTPETSYGTQKAICELLLADYSRRGIFDGIAIRLPTVCVRPGAPNKAASGFFSGIIREPLAGLPAILPVSDDVRHWMASPRATVAFLIHAAEIDLSLMKNRRCITMPGTSVTVKEQIDALVRVAGTKLADLIERKRDPAIELIVSGWARGFNPQRAESLGFKADKEFDDIVRIHIQDELGGKLPNLG